LERAGFLSIIRNRKALNTLLIVFVVVIIVVIVVGVAVAVILSSPGNLKTQEYTNSGFSALEVGSAFQVTITQSDTYSVKITAGERIFDRIQVTQSEETLKIEVTPGLCLGTFDAKAEITMPALGSVTLSGATRGTADGFNTTDQFVITVSGASSLDMTNMELGDVDVELSGASRLTAQGSGGNLVSDASGASNLNLENFPVNDATVGLSGASHAVVNPTGTLNVDASGASSLQYTGNPTLGTINTSGASTVNKK
jgi:hypothetical protein